MQYVETFEKHLKVHQVTIQEENKDNHIYYYVFILGLTHPYNNSSYVPLFINLFQVLSISNERLDFFSQ
jgi:hypothetical protein